MSAITQCPECGTRFKASQTQLEAHQGVVRCGHCQATFNAMQHLYDDEPSPQLSLPIETEIPEQKHVEAVPGNDEAEPADNEIVETVEDTSAQLSPPLVLAQASPALDTTDVVFDQPINIKKKRHWPWVVGVFILSVVLLAQASYFFRVELAARLPGLKPMFTTYCSWLKCSIPLPEKVDLMSIESSDLEASPVQANIIALNVILRNRAPYAQAYPNLELTLTDATDMALARRVFQPAEYLKPGEDENRGLSPSREISIKLHLDTTDLKPTGYRLFLFYP